jgi:glycosyltransferase involved in cell wall biosynthesis
MEDHALRVAIVAPTLGILGGQAVQAQRLIEAWRHDEDVHAWLVPINPVPPAPFDRLMRFKYVRTLITQAVYWPQLFRELRQADIVHAFSASYSSFVLAPLPAIVVSRLYGKPLILNYRSGEAPDHLQRSALARHVLARVDANVVPSRFLREVFAGFGIPAHVVANVVDLRRFTYRPRQPLRPRFLSTRNFERLYNVACTLRAFARIQARLPDASLVLVGSGSEDAALRELALRLRLANVTFAGRVAQAEIPRHYADADIYLQTPFIDNMPGSVIEAFASGLPVVATKVGGVPAILEHGVHGLLAAADDDESVARHAIRLLEAPDEARQFAEAALATCRAYEWSVVRHDWLAIYRAVARRWARDRSSHVEAA